MHDHDAKPNVRHELLEIGRFLIKISKGEEHPCKRLPKGLAALSDIANAPSPGLGTEDLIRIARSEYNERMRRSRHFQDELLGEPAWNILLDLFISRAKGMRISISSACIASQVPYTTALRWLKLLEQNALIQRVDDPDDGRRSWIELTDDGYQRMESYLRYCRPYA